MKLSLLLRDDLGVLDKKGSIQVVKQVLEENGVEDKVELSLSIVDEEEIKRLNVKYRGENKSTDVLSFPLEDDLDPDGWLRLGDVVLCWPIVERQADERKIDIQSRAGFLIVHGVLHLLGVHHD